MWMSGKRCEERESLVEINSYIYRKRRIGPGGGFPSTRKTTQTCTEETNHFYTFSNISQVGIAWL